MRTQLPVLKFARDGCHALDTRTAVPVFSFTNAAGSPTSRASRSYLNIRPYYERNSERITSGLRAGMLLIFKHSVRIFRLYLRTPGPFSLGVCVYRHTHPQRESQGAWAKYERDERKSTSGITHGGADE